MNPFVIYTAGGCLENPGGPGGWGVVIIHPSGLITELSGNEPSTTNNRMEMQAAIAGLQSIWPNPARVELWSDSKYLVDGMQSWVTGWQRRNWITKKDKTPVKNKDLWQLLIGFSAIHQIKWKWLKGHAGHRHNERCDFLATREIAKITTKGMKI